MDMSGDGEEVLSNFLQPGLYNVLDAEHEGIYTSHTKHTKSFRQRNNTMHTKQE